MENVALLGRRKKPNSSPNHQDKEEKRRVLWHTLFPSNANLRSGVKHPGCGSIK
jgi:hypothetical protein